jgi:hypothetical protein
MRNSQKHRLATSVATHWLDFQEALSDNRRKYPTREFHEFAQAVRRYVDLTRRDRLVHRTVAEAINRLTESLRLERKRVPGDILYEADRLECLFFEGYDPHFEGNEPPGL